MTTVDHPSETNVHSIASEWRRLELLGHCLQEAGRDRKVSEENIQLLRQLQDEVTALRLESDEWHQLPVQGLSMLEMDILSCAIAPEAQPRLAWLYQSLQPGITHAYSTIALIQALLAIEGEDVGSLRLALAPNGLLRMRKLIDVDGDGPFQVVRATKASISALLQIPAWEAPPGATVVNQSANWDDLILAADRKEMIREFMLWIQHRHVVVDQWLGQRVGGPVALFSGPSGTGKTYAAVAISSQLGWPLYRVDLGKLVSKYIGETEKNLNQLFDAAHGQQMVLQFDEVDSIMGKRAEIREARDRYANMEVSHLLSRIENHDGPCVLTTNLRGHLDQAFYRRFQVVVEFPMPDAKARTTLWQRLLPSGAPLENDVAPEYLGSAVSLTGGGIRNAALHAAYLAADSTGRISLEHIAIAIWRELTKSGKGVSRRDLGPLESLLPPTIDKPTQSHINRQPSKS